MVYLLLSAIALSAAPLALAQEEYTYAETPLISKRFDYTALPYQVDDDPTGRGPQTGYNICNTTTAGQESLCQTAIINSLDDFCLWGPPEPNSDIGSTEGEAVAWCTKPEHGTRVIPRGALTGVQFIKTPDYVQVTGHITQELINILPEDFGGEMDSGGADGRGNPLGGLIFTNSFNGQYSQVVNWHNFMGGGVFCLKACDPTRPNSARYCEHIYDRIGCHYNAPADYEDGAFSSCQGESQDFPGIYTDSAGVVQTYTQPAESLGVISTMPFLPKTPATSQCETFESAALYTNGPQGSVTRSSTSNSSPTSTRTRATPSTSNSASADTPGSAISNASAGFVSAFAAALMVTFAL